MHGVPPLLLHFSKEKGPAGSKVPVVTKHGHDFSSDSDEGFASDDLTGSEGASEDLSEDISLMSSDGGGGSASPQATALSSINYRNTAVDASFKDLMNLSKRKPTRTPTPGRHERGPCGPVTCGKKP